MGGRLEELGKFSAIPQVFHELQHAVGLLRVGGDFRGIESGNIIDHGHPLHASVGFASELIREPGRRSDITVTGGIDHEFAQKGLPPGFGIGQHAFDAVSLDDRFHGGEVTDRCDPGVIEQIVHRHAHDMRRELMGLEACRKARQHMNAVPAAVDEFLGEARDDLLGAVAHMPDVDHRVGGGTAHTWKALEQDDLRPVTGSSDSGGNAGGTASDDNEIGFMGDRQRPGRNPDFFHDFFRQLPDSLEPHTDRTRPWCR